ncbi:rsmF, partial [Symbiodinium sp. CCMP2456]
SLDGRRFGELCPEAFDAILVDAPCSGEGNIRKDPKAFDRWAGEDATSQCQVQSELLRSAWVALRPGGVIVYSTCTLNAFENENQSRSLLDDFPDAELQSGLGCQLGLAELETPEGFFRVWPHKLNVEGFFVACFRKKAGGGGVPQSKGSELWPQFQRLPETEASALRARAIEDLGSFPSSAPLLRERHQGDVWLCAFPCWPPPAAFARLSSLVQPGICIVDANGALTSEIRLVVGGSSLTSEEWLELHEKAGGGLGAKSLALRGLGAAGARRSLEEMRASLLTPDVVSYNTVLDAFAKEADAAGAQQVMDEMVETTLRPGVISHTILIEAHARAGNRAAAEEAFEAMRSARLEPNEVTYTALLRARIAAGDQAGAQRLAAEGRLNEVGFTLLINAYAMSGDVRGAKDAFELLSKQSRPNLASYTALMKAYAKARDARGADEVLVQIQKHSLQPNSATYATLISAQAKAQQLQRALELFRLQGKPTLASGTALISAYSRQKDSAGAQRVLDEMLSASIRPDGICIKQLEFAKLRA